MTEIVTVSTKGQLTLPAEFRRAIEISAGDQLVVDFHPTTRTLSIRKSMTVEELADKYSKYARSGQKHRATADEIYQQREPRS